MKIEYPKYLYHATHAPRIVASQAEHEALGSEWAESPAEATVKAEALEAATRKPVAKVIPSKKSAKDRGEA